VGLILERVSFAYATPGAEMVSALAGVSLAVAPGEVVLVLGRAGSGKSTLLKIAAGVLDGFTGDAHLEGAALTGAAARGRVGLVFQDPESQLFADTVLDDVAFGPRNLGLSRDDAETTAREVLDRVGLSAERFGQRSPFTLSGGEARRAAIAGVLAMSPSYLLLDEPTAGLDAPGRMAVREIVRGERERCGIVVVSHSAEEFLRLADRVLLLAEGATVFSGPAEGLLADADAFARAGLLAPVLLRLQALALESGVPLAANLTLDPDALASALLDAGGRG
jgi:energy-coupling factor transport system ATP-binding protein